MQYHPDRNPGDAEAAEKFKEATEAYEVLRDAEKRGRLRPLRPRRRSNGMPAAGSAAGVDLSATCSATCSAASSAAGGGGGRRQRGPQPGRDLQVVLDIDLRRGRHRRQEDGHRSRARSTASRAAAPGRSRARKPAPCQRCGGQGVVIQRQGFFQVQQTCRGVRRAGAWSSPTRARAAAATAASSAGGRSRSRSRPASTPATASATPGKGDAGDPGAPRGDLEFVIRVHEHQFFQRDGAEPDLPVADHVQPGGPGRADRDHDADRAEGDARAAARHADARGAAHRRARDAGPAQRRPQGRPAGAGGGRDAAEPDARSRRSCSASWPRSRRASRPPPPHEEELLQQAQGLADAERGASSGFDAPRRAVRATLTPTARRRVPSNRAMSDETDTDPRVAAPGPGRPPGASWTKLERQVGRLQAADRRLRERPQAAGPGRRPAAEVRRRAAGPRPARRRSTTSTGRSRRRRQAGDSGPLVQGVTATVSQFLDVLKRHGVTRIDVGPGVGVRPEPAPGGDAAADQRLRPGGGGAGAAARASLLHDRVLRPASVIVAAEPPAGRTSDL